MTKKKKIIIGAIIGIVILIIGGLLLHAHLEVLKWRKYDSEHNIDDNLLTVNCEMEDLDERIVSCTVDIDDKTSNYDSLSINIKHSSSVSYLSHEIPTEEVIYDSHETTSYGRENINDRVYVSNLDKIADLAYLLNIKFKAEDENYEDEELEFDYLSIIKDSVYHYTNDVTIKLGDLIKEQ